MIKIDTTFLNPLSEEKKKKLFQLIKVEFESLLKIIDSAKTEDDFKNLLPAIHKAASKYEILGMKETFLLATKIEETLKLEHKVKDVELLKISTRTQKAILELDKL